MCSLARFVPAFLAGLMLFSEASAATIEAERGKEYQLTKRHGPWMIMVASFKQPPDVRRTEGMTPKEAADQLVYELRKAGIPAYTYSQDENQLISELNKEEIQAYSPSEDEVRGRIKTLDRQGRERTREFSAKQNAYCVLAGNYESNDESTKGGKLAKDTLAWIEDRFKPDFLTVPDPSFEESGAAAKTSIRKLKSGGILRLTPGKMRQGESPLAGAFLTLNPLLSKEEIQAKKQDPLLIKLNSGNDLSLYNNPGKYTLVVASFYGKSSKAQVGMMGLANFREAQASFEPGKSLDVAAEEAWNLANLLRRGNFVTDEYKLTTPMRTRPGVNPGSKPLKPGFGTTASNRWSPSGRLTDLDDPRIAKLQHAFGESQRARPNQAAIPRG